MNITPDAMAPFKVIIVGGSITGLALANMLEQYGIDFVVLEKHDQIAPQLGAGFGIWPNGARILDQLGCYETLEKVNEPVNSIVGYDGDGINRVNQPEIGHWMEELFGYKMRFMERRHIVQGLFDRLSGKSKMRTSTEVVKILSHPGGVTVESNDGSVFEGDLVVGADGIHSRVRQEMQRLAGEEPGGRELFPDKDAFKCTHSGLFGISRAPKAWRQDEALQNFRQGRCYLIGGGPDEMLYWVVMFQNGHKTQGQSIPRYTREDCDRFAARCENDLVRPGVRFGEIYRQRRQSALVPLEEGILKRCFYKRLVLVGDSWHKMNPISGQGGNHAVMSAACLADELKCLVERDEASIQRAFRGYQRTRESEVRAVVALSHQIQRMQTLETPLLKFTQLYVAPRIPIEAIANGLAIMLTPSSIRLKCLPLPLRQGLLPCNEEVKIQPKSRSSLVSTTWVLLLVLAVLAFYPSVLHGSVSQSLSHASLGGSNVKKASMNRIHYNLSLTAVTTIMCIESSRQFFFMQILGSAVPFGILSLFIGWELVIPIYFALFIYLTGARPFYYPSARAVDLATVKALQPAYIATYALPTIYSFISSAFPTQMWMIAHAGFPVVVQVFRTLAAQRTPVAKGPRVSFGHQDSKLSDILFNLRSAQQAALFLSAPDYRTITQLTHVYRHGSFGTLSSDEASTLLLAYIIAILGAFAYFDARRVGAWKGALWKDIPFGTLVTLAFSPTTALCLLWTAREANWTQARQRKPDET
ncbi:uncharacterized protein N7459_005517 [Penicillium hispanicum]|uniref:uncharacterized protein n=1 Tax=Penicillium hispanicum TaxID=1080232 RepID=UPI00253FE49C|nr:uncharacterized protein N7459_005517 [Penicillium hispanicum]KAJ5579532.1 hypothetical protein N7459_005517 [Penicillium hispanicum]